MSVKSVYLPRPEIEGDLLRMTGDEHHHLSVARAEAGESVEVFDGRGGVWNTAVVSMNKRETVLRVLEKREVPRQGPEIFVALSLIKSAAFELALEKIVEVGVSRIIPMIARRSNVSAPRKTDRWTRIVVEAAKQSKRYHLPVIEETLQFERVLEISAATKIVFAERGGGPLESALAGSPALMLIGPEGGWTDEELEAARLRGFHLGRLGDGILRSETAAIVGAALLRYELE